MPVIKYQKVISCIAMLIILASGFAHESLGQLFSVNVSADLAGHHATSPPEVILEDPSVSISTDVKAGYSITFEAMPIDLGGYARFGLGAEAQLPRGLEDAGGKMNFQSVFLMGRVKYPARIAPFLVGRFGFNIFGADTAYKEGDNAINYKENYRAQFKNDFNYGVGGGVFFGNRFYVEGVYVQQNVIFEAVPGDGIVSLRSAFDFDVTYSRFRFALGYVIQ